MADTTYTDNVTVITADTMNDLNRLHYTILGDPATGAAASWKLITDLSADAAPVIADDYVMTSDASASTGKKVLLKNLFVGSGNVGIGNASPSVKLHVGDGSTTASVFVDAEDATAGGSIQMQLAGVATIGIANKSGILGGSFDATPTLYFNGGLLFHEGGVERARIATSGNFGIGIANPSYKLVVSDGGQKGFEFAPTEATPLLQVYNRSTLAYEPLQISAKTIRFNTGTSPGEGARLDENGYLLVGYTSSNGAYRLQVNSQIFATNSTVATSDGRYKDNVNEITGALDIISALRPVSFRWKKHPIHNFDLDSEQLGFIAQEVGDTLDQAGFKGAVVKTNRVVAARGDRGFDGKALKADVDEEFLGLAEGKLLPLLVAAVKELRAEVEALKAR